MYDETRLALQMICPSNEIVEDDRGIPSIFVPIIPMTAKDLLHNQTDSSTHPAFLVNGKQDTRVLIGKYEGYRNKGAGHHLMTAAEWGFLALWCRKNGFQPKGNNNFGKDHGESTYVAVPTTFETSEQNKGKTAHIATGTGPDTWYHDGTKAGIADLNGNVWEWVAGIRLVHGELQVIPYNNAADGTCDMSATSKDWRAVNYNATNWSDLYLEPVGEGTTESSVKLDMKSNKWTWQKDAISGPNDSSRNCLFKDIQFGEGISEFCKDYLRLMALAPDAEAEDSYNDDRFYANNGAAERLAVRGGYWSSGTYAGVFSLYLGDARALSSGLVGARCAFRVNQ